MSKKTLQIIGFTAAIFGIAITLYTVFDGTQTDKNIRNAGWIFLLIGLGVSMYARKK